MMSDLIPLPSPKLRSYWPTHEWNDSEKRSDIDELLGYESDQSYNLGQTYACIVIQSGDIIGEHYGYDLPSFTEAKPVTRSTKLLSWSVAKSILHAVFGLAVSDKIIDLEENSLFGEWNNDLRSDIRVIDLLQMRDGLDFVENYTDDRVSDVIEMLFGKSAVDMSGYAMNKSLKHKPSTVFNYSSGTSNILSRLLFDRLGGHKGFNEYIYSRLFDVIGMTSVELKYDELGVWTASSYVYATARDYARFGFLYLNGGIWSNSVVLDPKWVDFARDPVSVDPESGFNYGALWWMKNDGLGTFWADGFEGQLIVVCPKLDALIVRFGKTTEAIRDNLDGWVDEVLTRLQR